MIADAKLFIKKMNKKIIFSSATLQHYGMLVDLLISEKLLLKAYLSGGSLKRKGRSLKLGRKIIDHDGFRINILYSPWALRSLLSLLKFRSLASISLFPDYLHDLIVAFKICFLDFDILIVTENSSLLTSKVAKLKGAKIIIDLASIHPMEQVTLLQLNSNEINGRQYRTAVNRKIQEFLKADYFVCCSNFARETYLRNTADRICGEVIYPYIHKNMNNLSIKSNKSSLLLGNTIKLLFVGNVRFLKGFDILIKTLDVMSIDLEIELLVAGNVEDSSLKYDRPYINYLGFLTKEDLAEVYQDSDVVVLPSRFDSFGIVVCEALSFGTLVVVSKFAGASEIIKMYPELGEIFDGTSSDLIVALRKIMKDDALMSKFDRQNIFKRRFDWDYRRKYLEVINKLI